MPRTASPSHFSSGRPLSSRLLPLLLLSLSPAVLPGESLAAAPVSGFLTLLPPTNVVGDGSTPVDLYFLALDPKGAPIGGLKLVPYIREGTISALEEVGSGLHRLRYTPPSLKSASSIAIELRGKIGKSNYTGEWAIPVAPDDKRSLSLSANPPALTLGVDKSASLALQLSGADVNGSELLVSASVGTIQNLTNLGGGSWNALYTPPTGSTPQVAILTAADRRDPGRVYATLAVPLSGAATPVVTAPKGSRVLLTVGGRQFGPIPVDKSGKAKVPVVIPPGVRSATQANLAPDGTSTPGTLDLKLPETRRLAFVPLATVPADPRLSIPVRLMVTTPEGQADSAAGPTVTASAGTMGEMRHEGSGVYVGEWKPPSNGTNATLTATLGPTQTATLAVPLSGVRPETVTLAPTPAALPIGPSLSLLTRLSGPDGAGIPGRTLAITTNGAKVGATVDKKSGDYQTTLTPTGTGPVEVFVSAPTPATKNPLDHILLFPDRELVPADSLSSVGFTVVSLDSYGYPVGGKEVTLTCGGCDGSLPSTVTTDPNGVGHIYYTAGSGSLLLQVTAEYNPNIRAATTLFQGEAALGRDLPVSGSAEAVGEVAAWQRTQASVRVGP